MHVSIPVKHSKLGAKSFNNVCLTTVENALKWPLQDVNFQNFSGGTCPRTLWILFLYLNLLQNNSVGKNYARKNDEIWRPLKNSDYASNMKHFQRAYLSPFTRLHLYRFCIYSSRLNIQPNSKLHPPTKTFSHQVTGLE